ncbi:MAG: C4-type zinc ribbon domain-containing protein [Vicinamibacterales bacterium]
MLPDLAALIALQQLDNAAELSRRRLAELPGVEQIIATRLAAAQTVVDETGTKVTANQQNRRELEKHVAAIDTRLARFDDHKAAVKTNQEYTALLHEISTAKTEKDGVEEQILIGMDEADRFSQDLKAAEAALAQVKREGDATRAELTKERVTLEAEVTRLLAQKIEASAGVPAALLTRYEQLLKQRRMVAVAPMTGETCMACHVRMRPAVAQKVRRNAELIQCDSCQRILFFVEPAAPAEPAGSSASH